MHPSRTNDLAYPRRPVMDGPLCEAGRSGSLAVSVDGCQRQLEKPYVRARGTPEQRNTACGGRRRRLTMLEKNPNEAPPQTQTNLSIHLSSRLRLFPHARTHTTRPRPQTQKPEPGARAGQTSQPAPEGTGLGRTGPDRAGQARPQARHRHRHNSASSDPHIASAKYRITVSHLPSTGRQSQRSCVRRGEARRGLNLNLK